MVVREKNRLSFKYVFEFPINDWEMLRFIAERELDLEDLNYIEKWPAGWDFDITPFRRNPYSAWKLKLIEKNEKGGPSEAKYTYLIDFNVNAAKEVMQFLKYLNVFDNYAYTRGY